MPFRWGVTEFAKFYTAPSENEEVEFASGEFSQVISIEYVMLFHKNLFNLCVTLFIE